MLEVNNAKATARNNRGKSGGLSGFMPVAQVVARCSEYTGIDRYKIAGLILALLSASGCGEVTVGEYWDNGPNVECDVFMVYASEVIVGEDANVGRGFAVIANRSKAAVPLRDWRISRSSPGVDIRFSELVREVQLPPLSYVGRLERTAWIESRLTNVAPDLDVFVIENLMGGLISMEIINDHSQESYLLHIGVHRSPYNYELTTSEQSVTCGV